MRWTRQRRARTGSQGGLWPVSDRPARRRPALKRLRRNFGRQHMSRSRRFGGGSRGRQKRVVLAPVAGVKLMEIFGPNRASAIANPSATVARGIRRRGERAISRKTIAQGRPGVPAHLAITRVHFCARSRVLRAPGFPCALFDFRGQRNRITSGAWRRENVKACLCCHEMRRRAHPVRPLRTSGPIATARLYSAIKALHAQLPQGG